MEALSRQEYPAMLERLTPQGAVQKLNERVKKIGKVNSDIAGWLQDRRKVEEAYVAGLRKLAQKPLQETGGDLGIFEGPWRSIVSAIEETAKSHSILSERILKDVEQPLQSFATNREMSAIATVQGNLSSMARELEAAQEKSEKLSKKGSKASALKVDAASSQLQTANSQWDSQAPFIFEQLQALDERRLNHLRDLLTQYETHESDLNERQRKIVEQTLGSLLEVDTIQEIKNWSQASVAGKPLIERRARQQSTVSNAGSGSGGAASLAPPRTPRSNTDNRSEHSAAGGGNEKKEHTLTRRFGTMIGKRRQSLVGGFGGRNQSPNKGFQPFGRTSSRDEPSPEASSNNLHESASSQNRLSALAESPTAQSPTSQTNGNTGGAKAEDSFIDNLAGPSSNVANGTTGSALFPDLSDVQPPPGPPPSHLKPITEASKDSEGYTVPAAMNDPISQAENDAALESDQQQFKLDIRNEPIQEQDADAQAALSNVSNVLSSMANPVRKAGTVRGRRDVRNTMYMPSLNANDAGFPGSKPPPSPGIAAGRAAALAALSSNDQNAPTGSDTTSIRSGNSLANHQVVKHLDMHDPGLNASIIETVSVSLENGETKTTKISGEIALAHNKVDDDAVESSPTIRINNFPNLEAIGPNRTFIHPVIADKPDEYTVDLSTISSKPSIAFTYKVHIDDENTSSNCPLVLKVAWKPQGNMLGLFIEYSLNPAYSTEPVVFHNLSIIGIYQGPQAISCQTKPSGTHNKKNSLCYWQLGDVTLTHAWKKIICRFTGVESAVPEPGHIEARWEIHNPAKSLASGISLSILEPSKGKEKEEDDPFADESIASPATVAPAGNWVEISTSKKLVSGKYEARQVAL